MSSPWEADSPDAEADRIGDEVFAAAPAPHPELSYPDNEQSKSKKSNEHPMSSSAVTTAHHHKLLIAHCPNAVDEALKKLTPKERRHYLGELDCNPEISLCVVEVAARVLGGPLTPTVGLHPCFLPGHANDHDLEITTTAAGQLRAICNRDPASRLILGCIDLYATAVASEIVVGLSPQALVRWRPRAYGKTGVLTLPNSGLRPLPAHHPRSARDVWAGAALYRRVDRLIGDTPDQPFLFSARFAAHWCGIPTATAQDGLTKLKELGALVPRPVGRDRLYEIGSTWVQP